MNPFKRKRGAGKTDFDVLPFGWRCDLCDMEYALAEFFDGQALLAAFAAPMTIDEICKILSLSWDASEKIKNLFPGDSFAVISAFKGKCRNRGCGAELDLVVWVRISIEDKMDDGIFQFSISDYFVIDGDSISVASNPGFYRGMDIAEGLHKLYLRWWYLGGEITVVCPFIGKKELEFFDRIGLDILRTVNRPKENPFKRIITRQATYEYQHRKWVTILNKIDEYLDDSTDNDFLKEMNRGRGLEFVMKEALFGVECGKLPKTLDNPQFQCADYFHGKMYGALLRSGAEMVITSYNYVDREVLQLESLAFVETSKENYIHHVEIFGHDQYMTITPQPLSS